MNDLSYTTVPYPLPESEVDRIIAANVHAWAVAINDNPVRHPGIIYLLYVHHNVGKGASGLTAEHETYVRALVAHGFTPQLYTILTLLFQRHQSRQLWDQQRHGHLISVWREKGFWPHLPHPSAWHEWIIRVNEGESVNVVFREILESAPRKAKARQEPDDAPDALTFRAASAHTPQEIEQWDSGRWHTHTDKSGVRSSVEPATSDRLNNERPYPPVTKCTCKACAGFDDLLLQQKREDRARRIHMGMED